MRRVPRKKIPQAGSARVYATSVLWRSWRPKEAQGHAGQVAHQMVAKEDTLDSQHPGQTMMFGPIMEDRPLLYHCGANRLGGRTSTTVVDCLCVGQEHNLPPCLPTTPAPIHVLAIHEKVFI